MSGNVQEMFEPGRERSRRKLEQLRFAQADPVELYQRGAGLAAAHDGWVTLRPQVQETAQETVSTGVFAALLTDQRFQVPLCSWVVGRITRRGPRPHSLGIQHSTGTKAVHRLEERGITIPKGWRAVQDHPRRGLVVEAPAESSAETMLQWLLRAGASLSSRPVTGWWTAEIHLPADPST